jgi:hypothetical protein
MKRIARRNAPGVQASRVLVGSPGHVDFYWDLILDWNGEEGWRVDFEVGAGGGHRSDDVDLGAVGRFLKSDVAVFHSLAREHYLKIRIDGSRGHRLLRNMGAYLDRRGLCAARYLNRLQVANASCGL